MTSEPPEFDETKAAALVGKVVLIGITYLDRADVMVGQRQWVGRIAAASRAGIVVELDDSDEPCVLPPDLGALRPALPGSYRLRHTGRVVVDPDFMTTWIHKQHGEKEVELRPLWFSPEWVYGDVDDPPTR